MLGDILFKYREKLNKLNSRIDRYSSIIEDYDKKIQTAKQKQVDYSSLSNSKTLYEKKIKSMNIVKKEYLIFINTSQYLLDSINSKPGLIEQSKFESLKKRCEELQKENDKLVSLPSKLEKSEQRYDKLYESFVDLYYGQKELKKDGEFKSIEELLKENRKLKKENSLLLKDKKFLQNLLFKKKL